MPTRLEELRKQGQKISNEIDKIETAETEARLRPYVGQCFVYQNSYGDGKPWPMYTCVTSLKGGHLYGWQFERTSHDIIEVRLNQGLYVEGRDYERISRAKFNAAYRALLKTLKAQLAD